MRTAKLFRAGKYIVLEVYEGSELKLAMRAKADNVDYRGLLPEPDNEESAKIGNRGSA